MLFVQSSIKGDAGNRTSLKSIKIAVELGHTISDYARNVVALGEMEHQTAGLFEPVRVSFRLSRNEP